MNPAALKELLSDAPVIAAVKDAAGLERCVSSSARVVFVLYGTVTEISQIVSRVAAAGKAPVVHLDLIDGLAARESAVDFIARTTDAAGIISTKPVLLHRVKTLGLTAIRRYFLLDSIALAGLERNQGGEADLVEVLPGAMPKVLRRIAAACPLPLIAGGLIADREDVIGALGAGALAVSSTSHAVWDL